MSTDTSPARVKFPKWTREERDLWLDSLETYSDTILGQMCRTEMTEKGDTTTTVGVLPPEDVTVEIVRTAARMADTVVEEMQYRDWIQAPEPSTTKRKRGGAGRTGTGTGTGSGTKNGKSRHPRRQSGRS